MLLLDPFDDFRIEGIARSVDAKGAVVHVTAGTAAIWASSDGRQITEVLSVELAGRREGDVIDVEIEAHADGIGRDKKIDIARLIQRDWALRVRGDSAPSTTAVPPRWRRINSAMA